MRKSIFGFMNIVILLSCFEAMGANGEGYEKAMNDARSIAQECEQHGKRDYISYVNCDFIDNQFFKRNYEYPHRSYWQNMENPEWIIKFTDCSNRVTISKKIHKLIKTYRINNIIVPEKQPIQFLSSGVSSKPFLVVENYIDNLIRDESIGLELYKKISLEEAANIAFVILNADVGDLAYQNLPIYIDKKGSIKVAFIDCGCLASSSDFSTTPNVEYDSFLEKLNPQVAMRLLDFDEIGNVDQLKDPGFLIRSGL